jgi:hypothetical protein
MKLLAVFKWKLETKGYPEKFYIYKVASLPLEVTLRHSMYVTSVPLPSPFPLSMYKYFTIIA